MMILEEDFEWIWVEIEWNFGVFMMVDFEVWVVVIGDI